VRIEVLHGGAWLLPAGVANRGMVVIEAHR